MPHYFGLDLGSSSIKGGVLDVDRGTVEHVVVRPFPAPVPALPPSHFEVDLSEVVTITHEVLRELANAAPDAAGLLVCSQMGGVLLTDAHHRPVTNYLSWRDQRVLEVDAASQNTVFGELKVFTDSSVLSEIGQELRPGSAVSLLFWLAVHRRLPVPACVAMSLGDYVVSALTASPPRTHRTMSLGTLHLGTGTVHTSWFQRIGIGAVSWPAIINDLSPVGMVRLGSRSLPCYPAVGDQQAALYGAGLQEGELSINVSTGSQVSLRSRGLEQGDFQTRPYFDGYLNTVTHLPAGRALNGLVDLLGELARGEGLELQNCWQTISAAVEATPSTDLAVHLGFFEGPMGDRGHIRNLRLENLTLGHLFRAAFEHMADNYVQCAARLSPTRNWKQVVLSGGLPQRVPALRAIIEQRFQAPLRMVTAAEETLEGLLQLARGAIKKPHT